MNINLKKATVKDSQFFLNLRNDNRHNSLNSKKITFNEHKTWFKKSLKKKG